MAAKRLTPREFWLTAASWGAAMTGGDSGACMYGFNSDGLVHDEAHRQACQDYIQKICLPFVEKEIAAGTEGARENKTEIDAMLEYLESAPVAGAMPDLDPFTVAYIKAALWSSNDESNESGGSPFDENYGADHIAPEALQHMIGDCAHFQALYGHLLTDENLSHRRGEGTAVEMAGHDFWLTRNGHGAGFWDGDWNKPVADLLTKAANSFSPADLYNGDDGRIYSTGGISGITRPASVLPAIEASDAPSPTM